MSKLSRKITYGQEFQTAKDNGVREAYELAKAAYGPSVGNVAIELNYGFPDVSRDGVTNLQKLHLEDPKENIAARIVVQGSEKSNKTVGDGTTAVVILTYHLYQEATKLIAAGHNRMQVKRLLDKAATEAIEGVNNIKIDADPKLARFVAKVSASDEAVGDMVADVVDEVGEEGNIIVEEFDGIGSYSEEVEGFWFRKGFTEKFLINDLSNLESRLNEVDILIFEKPLKSQSDIAPVVNKIIQAAGKGTELMIVGDVDGEALAWLALNKVNGNIFPTLVDTPVQGPMRSLFLDDLAAITGATVIPMGAKATSFELSMLGGADRVVVNAYSTTIIGGEGDTEAINNRLAELRGQLKEAESLIDREEISKRIAQLTGKISIIRVGAPTEVNRGEIRKRVEDAIAATQAALRDGVVPGGGVCLARVAPFNFKEAWYAPLETLAENAGLNSKEALFKVLAEKSDWKGYDLREYTGKTVDLLKVGIIDPAEVVKEAIRNATSVVGTLITTTTSMTFIDRDQVA
jgi:chaperonin GroEL